MTLEFNEEKHEYTFDGVVIPSVTQIIGSMGLSGIPFVVLEELNRLRSNKIIYDLMSSYAQSVFNASVFGTAVHKATELLDLGTLDMLTVNDAIIPYLDAWKKCKRDLQFDIIEIEKRVWSSVHWYAGTLDRVIFYQGILHLLDIKTSTAFPPSIGLQTEAYRIAFNNDSPVNISIKNRMSVMLKPDGNYEMASQKMFQSLDRNIFLNAVALNQWKLNNT